MSSSTFKEILCMLAVIVLGVFTMNPFRLDMSIGVHMTLFACLFAAIVLFAGFIIGERSRDERETDHRNSAGRTGYVLGLLVIVIAIVIQAFGHMPVDPWLIVALMAMVVGKVVARLLSNRYR